MDEKLAAILRRIDTNPAYRARLDGNFAGNVADLTPAEREAVRAHLTLFSLTIGESLQPGTILLRDSAARAEVYVDRHSQISGDALLTAKLRRLKQHLKNEGLALHPYLAREMERRASRTSAMGDEERLIAERERRNLDAMLGHPEDAQLRAELISAQAAAPTQEELIVGQLLVRMTLLEDRPGGGIFNERVEVVGRNSGGLVTVWPSGRFVGDEAVQQKLRQLCHLLRLEDEAIYHHLETLARNAAEQERTARLLLAAERAASFDGLTCRMCGKPRPRLAWVKGWRNELCPDHRNASSMEIAEATVARVQQAVQAARRH